MQTIELDGKVFPIAYNLGETVYHRAKSAPLRGLVTGIILSPDGGVVYQITWGDNVIGNHYEAELTEVYVKDYAEEL